MSTVRPELVEGLLFLAIERSKNGASTSSARTEILQTSPLPHRHRLVVQIGVDFGRIHRLDMRRRKLEMARAVQPHQIRHLEPAARHPVEIGAPGIVAALDIGGAHARLDIPQLAGAVGGEERSEAHTSELQSLMRSPYAVFF